MDYQMRFLELESTSIASLLDIQETLVAFNPISQTTAAVGTHVLVPQSTYEDPAKPWDSSQKLQHVAVMLEDTLEDLDLINKLKVVAKSIKTQIAQKLVSDIPEKNSTSVAAFVDRYKVLDENDRVEVALSIAFYHGDIVAEGLPRLNIHDSQAQYKVALKCAQSNGRALACFFGHFHAIKQEAQQAEIAKVAAQENGAGLSEYIGHFQAIRTPSLLQKILFNAAQSSGKGTARHIRNYIKLGLNDQDLLFKAASLCFCQDPEGTSLYFLRFEIEDAENRYKLALLGAKKDGFAVANYFRNFKLTNQKQIFEVAKACARQNGLGLAIKIGNFGITHQQKLVTIAKIAARHNPGGVSSAIHLFKIEEEKDRIAIALIAATFADMPNQETSMPRFIENYTIRSETDRAQIALVLATTCGKKLLEHLDKFNLSRSTQLQEIITTALKYTWIRLLSQERLNEKDWDVSNYLPIMVYSKGLLGFLTQFSYLHLIRADSKEKEIHKIYQNLQTLMLDELKLKSYQTMVFEQIYKRAQDFFDQQRCLYWMIPLMMIMKKSPEVTKLLTERHFIQILKYVAELSNSVMRGKFTAILVEMCTDNRLLSVWLALTITLEIKLKKHIAELPSHIQLVALALSPLANLSEAVRVECEMTLSLVHAQRLHFRSSRHLRDFLELLFLLSKYSIQQLASSEIATILKILTSVEKNPYLFSKTVCMVRDIIHFGRLEKLIGLQGHMDLSAKMQEIFQEEFDIGDAENFATRYHETFGRFRNQDAVLTYGNKLKSIAPHESLLFNEYVRTVLDQSFLEARYQLEKNPHLRFLDHKLPKLLRIWRQGDKAQAIDLIKPETFTICPRQEPQKCMRSFVIKKIGQEQRLTPFLKTDYPYLARSISILQSICSEEDEREKLKAERENLQLQLNALNKDRPISKEKGPLKNRLSIESLLLKLLDLDLSQTEICQTVERLLHLVPKKNPLAKDLTDLWKDLTVDISTSRLGRLTVEDTDDPCDLLLLCTEVSSCLDINGDPEVNKCLQAYLLDGKIRAVTVKNEKGHIIARSVVRLLWDSKEETAVLFQERAYTSDPDPLLSKLLRAMAKRRAENLKIPLAGDCSTLSVQNKSFTPYPNPLRSLKSKAAFEYVDALEGIVDAPYEIKSATLFYTPSEEGLEGKV